MSPENETPSQTESNGQEAAAAQAPDAPVEQIHKVYAKDLREKQKVSTVFRVTKKSRTVARSGRAFLAVTLADRSGEIEARVFDGVEAAEAAFAEGDYLLVSGDVTQFQGRPQIVIASLQKLDPEPLDPKEFEPPSAPAELPSEAASSATAPSSTAGFGALREQAQRLSDARLKELLLSFLEDPAVLSALGRPYGRGPKGARHNGAEHVLSLVKLASRLAEQYPMADRELLIAGAFLHDIGRTLEPLDDRGHDGTDEGRLVGHSVLTAQRLHQKASRIDGFPALLEQHLTHLVLVQPEGDARGGGRAPVTLEALLLGFAVTMDQAVGTWLDALGRDSHPRWADATRSIGRFLWKDASPTSRGKSPTEPRKAHGKRKEKEGRPPRPIVERAPRPEAKKEGAPKPPAAASLPKEMTFKPFASLSSLTESEGTKE